MAATFNEILRRAGIDPAGVRLLRHVEKRARQPCFDAAVAGDPDFEAYQESQNGRSVVKAIEAATHIAGFVVDPATGEVVFAGLWEVRGRRKRDGVNPFVPPPDDVMRGEGVVRFETRRVDRLDAHRGKLVIDWGPAPRAWVQRADRRDKPILGSRPLG